MSFCCSSREFSPPSSAWCLHHWLPIEANQFLLIRIDMSHEAKEAAFTNASRRRRVRGCRIVIRVPVSATQGANRAALKRLARQKGGLFLDGPRGEAALGFVRLRVYAAARQAV
jgi:hypothetical protein